MNPFTNTILTNTFQDRQHGFERAAARRRLVRFSRTARLEPNVDVGPPPDHGRNGAKQATGRVA
jgi:hypothetical protein